ncbi:hypothetical protein LOTGIDRAFT_56380, partial [Lottia gigantea]
NLPVNITQLDLSYNSITILYNGDFKHLNRLQILYLGENPLTAIQSSAFEGLLSLQSLYLNFSFSGLSNLNYSIRGLENLETLDLSVNKLNLLNSDFFQDFPNLKTLRLSRCLLDNNFMFQHGKRLFTPLTRLNFLDLSQNDLVLLSDDIFEPLPNIVEIILTYNKLIRIPDVSSLNHLQNLYF